jgi:hypothetical protein
MPEVDDILRLAAIIRRVDGNHDKGAAALAEAILSHPDSRWQHAKPEPQGPSDQELLRIYRVATPCYQVEEYKRELDFARAVLARWGRPAIEPVPTSERPWEREGWCDAEGRCYGWDGDYWWMVGNPGWANETITHWLPHWALPVPGLKGADA